MHEFQPEGMQSLPFYMEKIRVIEKITDQWMPDRFHMDTDLMGTPGFQF